jgi:hypothetical protein
MNLVCLFSLCSCADEWLAGRPVCPCCREHPLSHPQKPAILTEIPGLLPTQSESTPATERRSFFRWSRSPVSFPRAGRTDEEFKDAETIDANPTSAAADVVPGNRSEVAQQVPRLTLALRIWRRWWGRPQIGADHANEVDAQAEQPAPEDLSSVMESGAWSEVKEPSGSRPAHDGGHVRNTSDSSVSVSSSGDWGHVSNRHLLYDNSSQIN